MLNIWGPRNTNNYSWNVIFFILRNVEIVVWERERERERERGGKLEREREGETDRQTDKQGTTTIYTMLRYKSIREPFFFVLLSRETDKKLFLPIGHLAPSVPMSRWFWLVFSADCSPHLTTDVEHFCYYIFFDAHTFLPTQFTWHFLCTLFTLRLSCAFCFWNTFYSASQRSVSIRHTVLLDRESGGWKTLR